MTVFNLGDNLVTSMEALERLYAAPSWAALAKETDRIIPPYRAFIEAAPYVTLATAGPDGVDCSPRGGAPGFVRVHDEKTLLIPDRGGNNRIDSLRNILREPRIALHFLIPGCGETLRVKGRATISADPALAASAMTMTVRAGLPSIMKQAEYESRAGRGAGLPNLLLSKLWLDNEFYLSRQSRNQIGSVQDNKQPRSYGLILADPPIYGRPNVPADAGASEENPMGSSLFEARRSWHAAS